jgi:hypothetical protein
MALTFTHSSKLIGVPQADAVPLLIQDLVNAIRDEEASERGIAYDHILDASGKEDLGGGVYTGITAALRSTWKLNFASGAYQATITGGNLADALQRVNNTGSPQVVVLASAAATVVNSGGSGTCPTASQVATAVRAELSPELANLDAAVSDVPADVLAAAQAAPIHADVKRMNGAQVQGDGTANNKWRGNV